MNSRQSFCINRLLEIRDDSNGERRVPKSFLQHGQSAQIDTVVLECNNGTAVGAPAS